MAYLSPHYPIDAFVSYSHGNPRGEDDPPLRRWSLEFVKILQNDIIALEGAEFDDLEVWCDEKIDPTAKLTDALRAKAKSAAILIILISKRYLESSWCREELEWFKSQVRDRGRDHSCVMVVRVQSTSETDWPDFILDERGHGVVGFRFHPSPEPGVAVEPYGWHDLTERPEPFRKELSRLRTIFTRRLRELRERADRLTGQQQALMDEMPGRRPRIYLHARPGDHELRSQVEKALASIHVDTVAVRASSDQSILGWSEESKRRIELAERCDALALLRPGHETGDGVFYPELLDIGLDDRERIATKRGRSIPCAVLDDTTEPLPSIATRYGIERFWIRQEDWQEAFRSWLDHALPSTNGARDVGRD